MDRATNLLVISFIIICLIILVYVIALYIIRKETKFDTFNEDSGQQLQHEFDTSNEESGQKLQHGCQINLNGLENPPMVLDENKEIIYPELDEKFLRLQEGHLATVHCPDWMSPVLCLNGTLREIEREVNFAYSPCKTNFSTSVKSTEIPCGLNGKELIVGIEAFYDFIPLYRSCFNYELQAVEYVEKDQPPIINQPLTTKKRSSYFRKDFGLYNISVEKCYMKKYQRRAINLLLGLSPKSTKYIRDESEYYLARGHLIAHCDNYYEAEKKATFRYINAAPMWQTLNNSNWKKIEDDIRQYEENNNVTLKVRTLCHGIATLPHEVTGEPTELYLWVDKFTKEKKVPVPAIFLKAVYYPVNKQGIVVIGINNPHESNFDPICEDVSSDTSWLTFKKNDQRAGYCYAISIDSCKKAFPGKLPNDWTDGGLLL